MKWRLQYRLRLRRKLALWRAFKKRRQLKRIRNRTNNIKKNDVILICTCKDEFKRLPYFLSYYRDLGVNHFLCIDNNSTDDTAKYLKEQPDVSLWHTKASYKKAAFGVHWMNWLARRYCHNHWVLTVDVDEFFIFPFCDTRPIGALTDWLDDTGISSFSAMLIDMYPKEIPEQDSYLEGQNPLEIAQWFDSGNYSIKYNPEYYNLWIQGGPRARVFFKNKPEEAPSLNKIPLVKWHRSYAYMQSTHMLLPRGLNLTYETNGGEKASGALLHAKFLDDFSSKAQNENMRKEHYAGGREYSAYANNINDSNALWSPMSERYINWRQLEILGLLSKGNWA